MGVVTILTRSLTKCAREGSFLYPSLVTIKSFSSLSIQFRTNFFWSSCLIRSVFYRSSGRKFAIYYFASGKFFLNSLFDVGGSNCKRSLIFSLFDFVRSLDFSCRKQFVSRKRIHKLSQLLYLASCSFWNFENNFFSGSFLCAPFLLLVYHLATRLFDSSIFCAFSLQFCRDIGWTVYCFFKTCSIRSNFLLLLQICSVNLFLWIVLVDHMHFEDLPLISKTVRSVLLLFQ